MTDRELLEDVRAALRLVCEAELSRLAPDLSAGEFWAAIPKIQDQISCKRGDNVLSCVARQFDAAVAEARARKKGDELESMWRLAPKDRGF